jgi:hypothetical protein
VNCTVRLWLTQLRCASQPMPPPPLPLDSPQLPTPPPMLALVLGDIGAEHSPSAFMMQQADVRVCLPVSSRFTDGRSLPLPGAVALALQALLQKYPSYVPVLPPYITVLLRPSPWCDAASGSRLCSSTRFATQATSLFTAYPMKSCQKRSDAD